MVIDQMLLLYLVLISGSNERSEGLLGAGVDRSLSTSSVSIS